MYFQYLGTEQRRSSRRRRNITSTAQPPALEEVTHEDRQQNSVFESGGDTGGREDGNNILNLGEERRPNWFMEGPPIDFHNPNLVFGNLLDDFPMGSGEGHIARRPNPLREIRTRREYLFIYILLCTIRFYCCTSHPVVERSKLSKEAI